jgi:RluA family pseudouridine synthase
MKRFSFKVSPAQAGLRIDQFLAECDMGLSRRKIRAVLDAGGVWRNRTRIRVASRTVEAGDRIDVEFAPETLGKLKVRAAQLALSDADILHDDKFVIAINKPAGLPSQETRDQSVVHARPLLETWLKSKGRQEKDLVLVHRLDKETSGVLLFAKSGKIAAWLTDQFRGREVKKIYDAVVHGVPSQRTFEQRCWLSPIDKRTGLVQPVRSGGKLAITRFEVAESGMGLSLITCWPETGRSHQIRVHLAMAGHGIVGDKRYGAATVGLQGEMAVIASERHLLHARSIAFVPGPGCSSVEITAPHPKGFARFVELMHSVTV